jgi:hypothetical protein
MNTLSEAQKGYYGNLWTTADADRDGAIGINDAAAFFQHSGLTQDQLGNIWGQVSPQGSSLSPDQFVYYCELISMTQNGVVPNLQELVKIKQTGTPIPYPSFSTLPGQGGGSVQPQQQQFSPQPQVVPDPVCSF